MATAEKANLRQRIHMQPDSEDYGVSIGNQPSPSRELQKRVLEVVQTHSSYLEATAYPYCRPHVIHAPKSFLEGSKRLSGEAKRQVIDGLATVDHVFVVSLWTAKKRPEPLAGGGVTFDFILHPDSLEIVYSGRGEWRA